MGGCHQLLPFVLLAFRKNSKKGMLVPARSASPFSLFLCFMHFPIHSTSLESLLFVDFPGNWVGGGRSSKAAFAFQQVSKEEIANYEISSD